MLDYFENHELLTCNQSAFRKHYSTLTVSHKLVDDLLDNMNEKLINGACFFDLKKCFDTIDHTLLILKLEKYGIRNSELLWFSDHLQNRTKAVKIDGNSSSFNNLTVGVPQGSVLGPLLFLIFINDLPTCLTQTSINIYASDSTLKQVETILQTDVDNMIKWFYKNRLMLNRSKSYSMLITTNPMFTNAKLNISIDGETISQVSTMKYLGIDIDSKPNWNNHIDRLCRNISPKNRITEAP